MVNPYLFDYEYETATPAFGVLLADHFCESYGFQGHRSKGTKDWLMIYTIAGEGSFRVNQEVQICKKNDIAILAPGIPHHYATNEEADWDILWVHFLPLPEWHDLLKLPNTKEQLITMHIHEEATAIRIEQAFGRLIKDSKKIGKKNQDLAILSLTEILLLIQGLAPRLDERIEQTIQFMSEQLSHKHTLYELSRLVSLSESRFCHLFKEQTGETYTEVLMKMRLQRATKLLQLTTRKINEIACDIGFDSAYYFTRRFTAHFGISPSFYRKQIQQSE
jgi:AraC family transcriptional regulator of arabinose operon